MDLGDYEIVVLKVDDLEEVSQLLETEYLPREPLARGLRLTSVEPTRGQLGEELRTCLRSGLSVGARLSSSGRLVGYRMSKLDSDEPPKTTEVVETQVKPYRLLAKMMGDADYTDGATKVLSMFMVCVHRDHGRRGIGKRLIEACVELAVAQRCTQVITMVTSRFSKSIYTKLGYVERYTFDFTTLGPEWKIDCSLMDGNTTFTVMTKGL